MLAEWTLEGAKSAIAAAGFSGGSSSPLADGTPRWLISGQESSSFEAIGDPSAVTEVSLTLAISDAHPNGPKALSTFLGTWAPDAASFLKEVLTETLVTDVDQTRTFSGHSVHVQTVGATDGTLMVVSVHRT